MRILLTLLLALPLNATELTITPDFAGGTWLEVRQPFALALSRPLAPQDDRIAIFLGATDVTDLFRLETGAIVYDGTGLALPSGERELIVSFVSETGIWREAARIPIRIRTRIGLDKARTAPSLDLANKGQLGEGASPLTSRSARPTYQDGTMQAALNTEHARGATSIRTQGRIVGVTYANEALRFGEEGPGAPRIDLSDYRIDVQRGAATLSVGNVAYGSLRHLVNAFSSRGAMFTWKLSPRADVQLAALHGTSIAGWDNFLGLANRDHQVIGATVGFELIPSRAGALRLESTLFRGSVQPIDNFNQGAIRSAEKNEGVGLRLLATAANQRWMVDGGFTTSEFREGRDPELEDGLAIQALPSRRRSAYYADASLTVLKDRPLGRTRANVILGYHVERVDPLYRSLGASVQPDLLRHAADLTLSVGAASARLAYSQGEDNLEGLRSVLKTRTRRSEVNVGLPLATLTGSKGRLAMLWPMVSLTGDVTHQFGDFLPIDSDFSASQVPDQISLSGVAGAEWQLGSAFRTGYRYTRAHQDNRQTGRQRADFTTRGHALTFGYALSDRVSLGLDGSRDEAFNREQQRIDWLDRLGASLHWKVFGETGIGGSLSKTRGHNDTDSGWNRGFDSYVELFSGFPLGRFQQQKARLFLRYTNRRTSAFDALFGNDIETDGWTLTSGASVSLTR